MRMMRFILCDRRVLTQELNDVHLSADGTQVLCRHISAPREGAKSACFFTVEEGKEWATKKLSARREVLVRELFAIEASLESLQEISE